MLAQLYVEVMCQSDLRGRAALHGKHHVDGYIFAKGEVRADIWAAGVDRVAGMLEGALGIGSAPKFDLGRLNAEETGVERGTVCRGEGEVIRQKARNLRSALPVICPSP